MAILEVIPEPVLERVLGLLESLVQKFWSLDEDKIRDDIESLNQQLLYYKALLDDTNGMHKDQRQKQWKNDVMGLIPDIQILVRNFHDECSEKTQKKNPEKLLNRLTSIYLFVKGLLTKTTQLPVLNFVAEIEKIQRRISDIQDNRKRYAISALGEDFERGQICKTRKLNPIGDPDIVGFGTDILNIVGMLMDEEVPSRAVISIVGIGGAGKSTIALKVCNSNDVNRHFDKSMFITVSPNYVLVHILRETAKNLHIQSTDVNENMLANRIRSRLQDMRYLIVFDDVPDEKFWDEIVKVLPDKKNGSRVIITSRLENVAKRADTRYPPYKLPLLKDEESLNLFFKGAVSKCHPCPDPTSPLYCLAKQFVAKCKSVPLAVVVLSGLVATIPYNFQEWNKLLQTMSWPVDGRDCIDIIATNYEYWPLVWKYCFLYFAGFPESTYIEAESLYRIWVAEDLIQPEERRTLEEIAESILQEFVQRNMVQVLERFPDGSIKYIRIHNVLREFVVQEAQKLNFLIVCSKPDDWKRCSKARRVAIHYSFDFNEPIDNNVSPNVHSLLIFGGGEVVEMDCSKFRELRVLMCKRRTVKLQSFKGAPRLRYLQLEIECIKGNEIEFGEWVRSTKYLETLDLRESPHGDLSEWIWQLANTMRHILLSNEATEGPPTLVDIKYLQTMTSVRWNRSWEVLGFHDMSKVRKLLIVIDREIPRREIERFLSGLKNLRNLRIKGDITVLLKIDWGDFPFYENLNSLRLYNSPGNDSDHTFLPLVQLRDGMLPPNLTELRLEVDEFGSDFMLVLGKLESLKTLNISGLCRSENENAVRRIRCSSGGFKQLEELVLQSLQLEEWEIESDAMPMLKQLRVINCDPLSVPLELTNHMRSLQSLYWSSNIQANKDAISNILQQQPNLRRDWRFT